MNLKVENKLTSLANLPFTGAPLAATALGLDLGMAAAAVLCFFPITEYTGMLSESLERLSENVGEGEDCVVMEI